MNVIVSEYRLAPLNTKRRTLTRTVCFITDLLRKWVLCDGFVRGSWLLKVSYPFNDILLKRHVCGEL